MVSVSPALVTTGITGPGTISTGFFVTVNIDPPLIANPSIRYGIATLEYHHQNSVPGTSPDGCGGVERPTCWMMGYANAYGPNFGQIIPLGAESPLLTWQDPNGTFDCLTAVTPTRRSSWGSVKTLYR
jgi:hypothetical protein